MTNVHQLGKARGFTRMDNELYEALIGSDLSRRDLKTALVVHRLTAGYNKDEARIAACIVSDMANMDRTQASKSICSLIEQRVLYRVGGSRGKIGISPMTEWKISKPSSEHPFAQSAIIRKLSEHPSAHNKDKTQNPLIFLRKIPSPFSIRPIVDCDWKPQPVEFSNETFTVQPEILARWAKAYPCVDIDGEILKAAEWAATHKAKKDWKRFLATWLGNAAKRAGSVNETGVPVDKIIKLYHDMCPNLPAVSVQSDPVLRSRIVERWNESPAQQSGQGFWVPFFTKAARRSQIFYMGNNVQPRLESILSRPIFREISEART